MILKVMNKLEGLGTEFWAKLAPFLRSCMKFKHQEHTKMSNRNCESSPKEGKDKPVTLALYLSRKPNKGT